MKSFIIAIAIILTTGTGCSTREIEPQAGTKVNIPSGYEEYRNEDLGFSFMYPGDWELTDYADTIHVQRGMVVGVNTPDTRELIEARKLPPDSEMNLVVSHWDDINNTYAQAGGGSESRYDYESLEEYLTDDIYRMVQMQGETTVDGVMAYEVIVGGYGAYYGIMFEHNGLYQLLFPRNPDNTLSEEEKAVLDSFTLLEQ
ncbi:MAG TPA: PsbP-related protein [Patescibacteria group bacterium]|nr:PsbP-related protein [Patescibacteria group bacterium]